MSKVIQITVSQEAYDFLSLLSMEKKVSISKLGLAAIAMLQKVYKSENGEGDDDDELLNRLRNALAFTSGDTKRPLSDALLIFRDPSRHLPAQVRCMSIKGNGTQWSNDPLQCLDLALLHLLPKSAIQMLKNFGELQGMKKLRLSASLYKLLGSITIPTPDRIQRDINEMFLEQQTEATAEEAFNRTLK